ncbi:hypothetical protein ACFPU1_06450 [Thalassorhabdus alkalitolerans]|uniref:DUF4177 domain-containing protein n=1 Tax=Thalassorhabdus alkalitolerans TaxID=2282697 RepID=A0ABW0YQN5_9BACI|nr:hypothetical protein [Thalassobacillus sp. C254]
METYKVRFYFDRDNYKTVGIKGESKKEILDQITKSKDKWLVHEENTAINMNLVTRVTFVKPKKSKKKS